MYRFFARYSNIDFFYFCPKSISSSRLRLTIPSVNPAAPTCLHKTYKQQQQQQKPQQLSVTKEQETEQNKAKERKRIQDKSNVSTMSQNQTITMLNKMKAERNNYNENDEINLAPVAMKEDDDGTKTTEEDITIETHSNNTGAEDGDDNGDNLHTLRQLRGAAVASGLAGMAMGGPVMGVLAAGGAVLAVSSKGKVGEIARKGGEAAAQTGDRIRKLL